jgi:hypothetical protein
VYDEVLDDSLMGYQWSYLTEKHPHQRKEYIKYLTDNLSDNLIKDGKQVFFVEDTASKQTLLDCNDQRQMPFAVKGSADVMIVDRVAKQHRDIFAGLRLVIEVKKDATDVKNRWQLLLKHIVSDLKSEKRRAPVGFLTDLNNNWYFLWFSADKEIVRYTLSCPANAFKFIKEILSEKIEEEVDGYKAFHVPFVHSANAHQSLKRQKLMELIPVSDDGATELLERYQLMADELSPEFLRDKTIEYALDRVKDIQFHVHVTCFFSSLM